MIGQIVSHYKILEKLGEGGMGVVYKAEDTKLKRTVALKFLPPELTRDRQAKTRFIQEAQAASALQHHNICTIHEIDETKDGRVFISMDCYEGETLKDKIAKGPLAADEAIDIVTQVAEGLAEAHEAGMVHRDIKPANIMVTDKGVVKILDFGLAKLAGMTSVTKTGTTVGTVAYLAPEQGRGQKIDHRVDIWSLGVSLYEMIAGRLPFQGDHEQAVLYSIMNQEPEPLTELRPDVPLELERIVGKAMAKKPDDRYQSADELLADLAVLSNAIQSGESLARRSREARAARSGWRTSAARMFSPHVLVTFLVVILIAVIFFGRKGGKVTETIAVTNEEGQTIERTVPKSEYRKSFAVYFFDNETGDSTYDWVQAAIPSLLEMDLYQDQILNVRSAFDPYAIRKLQRNGLTSWKQATWGLKRQIARDSHLDYLVTGRFIVESDEFVVKRLLHNTDSGKLVAEKTYRGNDLFGLVDEMSVDLKDDLGIPASYTETVDDLPVSEMMTKSTEALRSYSAGITTLAFGHDWEAAGEDIGNAVIVDSTFAYAQYSLMVVYVNMNQGDKLEAVVRSMMLHLYRLPERMQFMVKSNYYQLRRDPEKHIAVLRMMTELYPDDILGWQALGQVLSGGADIDEAIDAYRQILDIDPDRTEFLLTIGGLYEDEGKLDLALENYEAYAKKHPKDVNSYTKIAEIYRARGDYEEATKYFDKALLVEPENVSVLLDIADIQRRMGETAEAKKMIDDALRFSRTPLDSAIVYDSFFHLFMYQGQMENSFDYLYLKWEEEKKAVAPAQALIIRLVDAQYLVKGGQADEALEIVESIARSMTPPYDGLVPMGYMYFYLETEEPDSAQASLEQLMPFIEAYGLEQMRYRVHEAQGQIAELRGDYHEAIQSFEKGAEVDPASVIVYGDIGRCYRKLGELEKAETALMKVLKVYPFDPEYSYELALVYAGKGDQEKAMSTLRKSLSVWENADSVFEPARKAREKLAEWSSQL